MIPAAPTCCGTLLTVAAGAGRLRARWGTGSVRGAFLLACVLLLISCHMATAQPLSPRDSAAMEQAIGNANPGLSLALATRARLAADLKRGDAARAGAVLAFAHQRLPDLLTAAEQLLARLLMLDTAMLASMPELERLLSAVQAGPARHPLHDDRLYAVERAQLHERAERLGDALRDAGAGLEIRYIHNLLANHLTVGGLRGREELNARVAEFRRLFPASPFVPLAERYIVQPYAEVPFGAAVMMGYGVGWFTGNAGDRFGTLHGPTIGGEVYVNRITASAWFTFGVAQVAVPFTAAARRWEAGDAVITSGAIDVGYEFRFGRFAVTPLAGLALQNLSGADTTGADPGATPTTRDRLGLDVSVLAGLRVPFDVGPHLDLRLRVGHAVAALGGYDTILSGSLWYVQLGFALVQRPYRANN